MRKPVALFFASFACLYFELLIIRYLSTEVRAFLSLKNILLISSFFGIGLGLVRGAPGKRLRRAFPFASLLVFVLIRYAKYLGIAKVGLSWNYSLAFSESNPILRTLSALEFFGIVFGFLVLIVPLFMVLGGLVGAGLKQTRSLKGYGINLAGSLTGIVIFSMLAFFNSGPGTWLLLGFVSLIPFFRKEWVAIILFAVTVGLVSIPEANTIWSPYHKIEFAELPSTPGQSRPSGYSLVADQVWYQWMADLSPDFLSEDPKAEPNRSLAPYYELPYRLVASPNEVLVLGAGTGNDVAAALRHHAQHVDAIELDPVIVQLGQKYHPEKPYSSPRVTIHIEDARSFLKRTKTKYDLIVFAFLDSTTVLSSFSSLRLDNYVYTVESFREARNALSTKGTLALSFATGRSFPTDRIYVTLDEAFGIPPAAYLTRYHVNGVFMVEGHDRGRDFPELINIGHELESHKRDAIPATDQWPFLYLQNRTIPPSITVVSAVMLLMAWIGLRRSSLLVWKMDSSFWHFFFLGAGFLLLETRAVTELSLLFGTTWLVNAFVIGTFLLMALVSNAVASVWDISRKYAYMALLLSLFSTLPSDFVTFGNGSLSLRTVMVCFAIALPVFFSGLVFSQGLKQVGRTQQLLGMNLLGSVCGGLLENLVMIGGMRVLLWLSAGLYIASAVCLPREQAAVQES